jgi:hypothetical protein
MNEKDIDITFDVRTDSKGRDPDSCSGILRKYHKILWSKELPNGKLFDLNDKPGDVYLCHRSELGEFCLASDSIVHTYFKWKSTQHITRQIPKDEMECFYNMAHTVGGYIVFPGKRVNGQNTINQARGMSQAINDRMDLTLECIRRYYIEEASPLTDTLKRYCSFFDLFSDFKGYCEFFLLQDLVTADFASIKFFLPFAGFAGSQVPKTVDEYREYMRNNIEFLSNRNKRMYAYCNSALLL